MGVGLYLMTFNFPQAKLQLPHWAQTTGSVRIDSASATLRERAESGQINIKSTRFSTSSGTIQKAGDLYQYQ